MQRKLLSISMGLGLALGAPRARAAVSFEAPPEQFLVTTTLVAPGASAARPADDEAPLPMTIVLDPAQPSVDAPVTTQPTDGWTEPGEPPASDGDSPDAVVGDAAPSSPPSRGLLAWLPPIDGPPLKVDELSFDVGFDMELGRRRVAQRNIGRYGRDWVQTNVTHRFDETIGVQGAGSALGERFLQYQFSARYRLRQDYYRESRPGRDLRDYTNGDLLEYDARVTLFPAGKVTVNVFASQLDDRIPRMFLPSLDRRRERYGGEILYNDRVLPMRLTFESLWEELEAGRGEYFDDERRGERTLRYEATWQPSEWHRLRLEYEYLDRREQYSGTDARYDTTRNYLTLDHVLMFGSDRRSRLETLARFQEESGDLARDVYELAPQLRLQHTDWLATNYRLQWLKESYEGLDLRLFRGDVGADVRLGESLDTSFNVYALKQDGDRGGNDTTEWGALATAAFRKESDLGRFSATLSYNHATVRADGGGSDGIVISESVTFRDPLPVYLARTDVRYGSVVVTDSNRARTYLLGRDYSLLQVGRYMAINRIRTGNIADRQTVLVTYRYRAFDGYELDRDRFDVRVQHEFKNGLTPYYAGTVQAESLDRARLVSYVPRDIQRHRLGLTYRQKKWSVGGEFEYNDDHIDPYKAIHLNFDAVVLDKPPHSLGTRGNFSFFRFDGTGQVDARDTSLLDLGLTYRVLLTQALEASTTAAYRFEDDSLEGLTHGIDLTAAINWRIGLFTLSFELEYDLLDLPSSSDEGFTAWLRLRREIPLIGRPRR